MMFILKLILLIALFSIAYQDFRERNVYFLLFVIVGGLLGTIHFSETNTIAFIISISINISVILLLLTILNLYSRLKLKKRLKEIFGLGDGLFFIGFSLGFPTVSFLVLFSFSFFFSLVIFLVLKKRFTLKTVPLAGLQALFLSILFYLNPVFHFIDLYAM